MTTHLHKQLVIVRLRIWDRGLETAYVRFRKENFAKRVVETNFEKLFFWGGETFIWKKKLYRIWKKRLTNFLVEKKNYYLKQKFFFSKKIFFWKHTLFKFFF